MSILPHQPSSTPPSDSTFVTDHLALAAYLVSCGYEVALQPTPSHRVLFSFAATSQLNADVAAFNKGIAHVEPATYDAVRIRLRKQIDTLLGGAR